ncbi:UDP-glucosyltransferase 2-like [Malaya genurostris]|uniref:UDP-glucosyltransferase 2-like n=1 Tax=Malaya genurostris TaxID=325434 RepID=UPI0026F3FE13|nr:UDP-glucosyltransferase 2-like [Malaya genurostris]
MKPCSQSVMQFVPIIFAVLCALALPIYVAGSKILCFHASPVRSHVMIGQALMRGLAERGHEVTMVSSYKVSSPLPAKYREVVIPAEDRISKLVKGFLVKPTNQWKLMPELFFGTMSAANSTLNDPQFLALKSEQFDVVIVGLFMPDFMLGLGAHFGAPTVALFSAGLSSITADLVGNPLGVAVVPHMIMGKVSQMDFRNRLRNFLIYLMEKLSGPVASYYQRKYYEWNFPSGRYPSYDDVRKNVSLVLLNTHFSAHTPRPYLQNVIEVGGLQIKPEPDPLPEDIRQWLDGAEHGVIYFCLGSSLKSTDIPMEKLKIFVKTLAQLKQRVLWKWEGSGLPDQPANVMTKNWLPQSDVLGHRNVVLFISHGGLGGMAEARYNGVPVLGIPIYAEQAGNVRAAVVEGWALEVDYHTMTRAMFTQTVDRLLNEPQFRTKIRQISQVYRDRPQTALELACYWVEYVIRYRGAPQLHYPAADLNIWQKNSVDVIVFIAAVTYLVVKIISWTTGQLKRMLFGRRVEKQKTN